MNILEGINIRIQKKEQCEGIENVRLLAQNEFSLKIVYLLRLFNFHRHFHYKIFIH